MSHISPCEIYLPATPVAPAKESGFYSMQRRRNKVRRCKQADRLEAGRKECSVVLHKS
ncbi:MAG TPA: hypothetical protein VN982_12735 [Candidatus Dormibacteraeota bacterium]|nr:hypothetical protein [Candidatus Dormibacteraeota bacterium]